LLDIVRGFGDMWHGVDCHGAAWRFMDHLAFAKLKGRLGKNFIQPVEVHCVVPWRGEFACGRTEPGYVRRSSEPESRKSGPSLGSHRPSFACRGYEAR